VYINWVYDVYVSDFSHNFGRSWSQNTPKIRPEGPETSCFAKAVTCICFGQERLHKARLCTEWTGIASHGMWPWALKSANSNRQHPATSCNISCGLFWWALQLFLWARANCWTQPSPTFEMAKCCHRVPNFVQPFPFLHFFQAYLLLATASKAPWLWHWFVIVLVWNSDIFSDSWSILCHLPMFSGTFSIRTALLWYIAATEQRWRLPLS
jgi:hypothetical protein